MDTPNSSTPPPPGQPPIPPTGQPNPPLPGAVPPQSPPPPGYAQPAPPPPGYAQPAAPQPPPGYAQPQPPGAYPQQPGYGMAPGAAPQPEKKKRRWWIWILAVLFAFALLVGGCGLVLFRAVKGPIDKSNEMLALLADGEIDDASDLLDFDCFGNDGIDEFEAFFTANPVVSYDLTSTSNTNGNGETSGTVVLQDGLGSRPISFSLTNDDGWQVCGIDVDEP